MNQLKPFEGTHIFVRTVTFHYIGRLTSYGESFLTLEDASWIADSGRFADALANGTLSEVEPYPGACVVSLGAIVDISAWNHALPRSGSWSGSGS